MQKVLGSRIRRAIRIIRMVVDIQNRLFLAVLNILDDNPRISELAPMNENNIRVGFI